ncbi:hypothetical protein DOE73_29565 [Paenibacillus dendritiformis]|nr:hypothetical protein DOE73_29565 [Paenibacillus dendritiformis]
MNTWALEITRPDDRVYRTSLEHQANMNTMDMQSHYCVLADNIYNKVGFMPIIWGEAKRVRLFRDGVPIYRISRTGSRYEP